MQIRSPQTPSFPKVLIPTKRLAPAARGPWAWAITVPASVLAALVALASGCPGGAHSELGGTYALEGFDTGRSYHCTTSGTANDGSECVIRFPGVDPVLSGPGSSEGFQTPTPLYRDPITGTQTIQYIRATAPQTISVTEGTITRSNLPDYCAPGRPEALSNACQTGTPATTQELRTLVTFPSGMGILLSEDSPGWFSNLASDHLFSLPGTDTVCNSVGLECITVCQGSTASHQEFHFDLPEPSAADDAPRLKISVVVNTILSFNFEVTAIADQNCSTLQTNAEACFPGRYAVSEKLVLSYRRVSPQTESVGATVLNPATASGSPRSLDWVKTLDATRARPAPSRDPLPDTCSPRGRVINVSSSGPSGPGGGGPGGDRPSGPGPDPAPLSGAR